MDQKSSKDFERLSNKRNLIIKPLGVAAAEELSYMQGRMDKTHTSLKTCWKKFNQVSMDGIEWGSIITIAGMSGSGKTAILNELETSLFVHNPNEKFAVLSFNFEMLARRLIGRKISSHLNKSVKQLYSADLEETDKNLTKEDLIKWFSYRYKRQVENKDGQVYMDSFLSDMESNLRIDENNILYFN